MEFANARKFCRPNAICFSLLDDFVTTNFGTRAPRARAPPLEQNSGDATDRYLQRRWYIQSCIVPGEFFEFDDVVERACLLMLLCEVT